MQRRIWTLRQDEKLRNYVDKETSEEGRRKMELRRNWKRMRVRNNLRKEEFNRKGVKTGP
jgi:ribosomal protein S3